MGRWDALQKVHSKFQGKCVLSEFPAAMQVIYNEVRGLKRLTEKLEEQVNELRESDKVRKGTKKKLPAV